MSGLAWLGSWLGVPAAGQPAGPAASAFAPALASSATPAQQAAARGEEAAAVRAAIRAKEEKTIRAAWKKLETEFEVQTKVWASVALSSGAASGTSAPSAAAGSRDARRESATAVVRAALEAAPVDPAAAAARLRALGRPGLDVLGQATASAVHGVGKAGRQAQLLARLADAVAAAADAATAAPDDAQRSELESLVGGCLLGDALESRTRRALRLPPSQKELAGQAKAERAEARRAKAAEAEALQARIDRVAKAAGVPGDRARVALESAGGDADLALVMLLSEVDARRRKESEKAASAAQAREKEAAEVAVAMSELAEATPLMAWEQLRAEFRIQAEIWNTQSMLAASTGRGPGPAAEAMAEIEGAMDGAAENPEGAVLLLEMAMQNAVDRRLELCAGVLTAADRLMDVGRVAENRRSLARRLEAPLPPRRGSAEAAEAVRLLEACDLGDSALGRRAREVLGKQRGGAEDRRIQL